MDDWRLFDNNLESIPTNYIYFKSTSDYFMNAAYYFLSLLSQIKAFETTTL